MGRNAQPAAVKEAKGNPGRRPIAREGAPPPASALAPPKKMSARQKALWEQFAPELAAMRILRGTDVAAFRRYVVFLDKWEEAEKMLKTAQLVTVTSSEHVQNFERRGQWLMVAIMLDKRLSEIEDRFGMNPAARQRLMLQMAQGQTGLPLEQPRAKVDAPGGAADAGAPVEAVPVPESPVGLLN
jgi:P27 family predicted phage terminase small subunit